MKMKRFECVLELRKEKMSCTIITNPETLTKGSEIPIKGNAWRVKVAVRAETDQVQFGDTVHEVRVTTKEKKK